jgi:dihydropteroate synthase
MRWKTLRGELDLSHHGAVMGIVNVTPDSFSDGGRFFALDQAVLQGMRLEAEGARILDIGGESTRPGAHAVDDAEQIRRVVPVIRGLRERTSAWLSIDTMSALVAEAALEAGADIINDISGLTADPSMMKLAAESGAGVVIMHMQGRPHTMQRAPEYGDVVEEVRAFLARQHEAALGAGVAAQALVYDPGIGFGKSLDHNTALLRATGTLAPAGRPLLLGVSRKSFLSKLLNQPDLSVRDWPTAALTAWGRARGARVFRVHEVRRSWEALQMAEAISLAGAMPAPYARQPSLVPILA